MNRQRFCLSVCHPEADLRGAWCEDWGKIVAGRHKVKFRDQRGSDRDPRCVPRYAAQREQGTERQSGVERRGHRYSNEHPVAAASASSASPTSSQAPARSSPSTAGATPAAELGRGQVQHMEPIFLQDRHLAIAARRGAGARDADRSTVGQVEQERPEGLRDDQVPELVARDYGSRSSTAICPTTWPSMTTGTVSPGR